MVSRMGKHALATQCSFGKSLHAWLQNISRLAHDQLWFGYLSCQSCMCEIQSRHGLFCRSATIRWLLHTSQPQLPRTSRDLRGELLCHLGPCLTDTTESPIRSSLARPALNRSKYSPLGDMIYRNITRAPRAQSSMQHSFVSLHEHASFSVPMRPHHNCRLL